MVDNFEGFEPRAVSCHQINRAFFYIQRFGQQRDQSCIGRTVFRHGTHTHKRMGFAIRRPAETVEGIAPPFRRQAQVQCQNAARAMERLLHIPPPRLPFLTRP